VTPRSPAAEKAGVLAGTRILIDDVTGPHAGAAELLSAAGATIVGGDDAQPVDVVIGGRPPGSTAPAVAVAGQPVPDPAGVPAGTVAHGTSVLLAAAALLAHLEGTDLQVDPAAVEAQLLLPAVAAAAYGLDHEPVARPRRFDDGACAVGPLTAEDEETFRRLLLTFDHPPDAEDVASRAQQWRLPVCPYRSRSQEPADPPIRWLPGPPSEPGPDATPALSVVDLTSHWAGPLATWLLAATGARVVKVESRHRPDGFRRSRHGGPTPLFDALNRSKHSVDIDLGSQTGKRRFLDLVAGADLVIDSFSRRVLPNFGLSTADLVRDHGQLCTLSLPAFPPQHPFEVAYGPGIHAVRGLGDIGDGAISEPIVAYPDAVAGFTAFFAALALVVGRRRGSEVRRAEVTLFDAVGPLLHHPPSRDVARREADPGGRLLASAAATRPGWEALPDASGAERLLPTIPLRGSRIPVPSTPAPPLGGPCPDTWPAPAGGR